MTSKLPRALTWIICGPPGFERVACMEASPPARINTAIVRGGHPVRVVRVDYGRDHLGRWMSPDVERVLARSIYRRLEEVSPKPEPQVDESSILAVINEVSRKFGVTKDEILNTKIRKKAVKFARAVVAQELKRKHSLNEKAISDILRFKHKSCVAYWLKVPREQLVA